MTSMAAESKLESIHLNHATVIPQHARRALGGCSWLVKTDRLDVLGGQSPHVSPTAEKGAPPGGAGHSH